MHRRLWITLCASSFLLGLAAAPIQAAEARTDFFSMQCDETIRNVVITHTGLGASTTRFIQSAGIAIIQPRDGIKFMRLQAAAGDPTKTLVVMGFHEISKEMTFTSSMVPVSTKAAGTVSVQLQGSCSGGGTTQGFVTVHYFS